MRRIGSIRYADLPPVFVKVCPCPCGHKDEMWATRENPDAVCFYCKERKCPQ